MRVRFPLGALIKTVCFDLGGVMIRGITQFYKDTFDEAARVLGVPHDTVKHLIHKHEPALETGEIDIMQFWCRVAEDSGSTVSHEQLRHLWSLPFERHATLDAHMVGLVEKLKRKYIVGCISNTSAPHIELFREWPLLQHFDPVVLSSEIGLRKPGRAIFEHYLKQAGCNASEMVFIDDNESNLAEARAMGIRTILFANQAQLENTLRALPVAF
jgi:glucose-1-phosphatase